MSKYVKVMDGLKSNAGGFEYKLDEVNVTSIWNSKNLEPDKMGGFNFGTEDKILRWLHRGNTIYDVIVPDGAEVILCDQEKGIYRANKIIVTNPRNLTEELVLELCDKTTLSDKVIAQCLCVMLWKQMPNVSKYLIKNHVNKNNADLYLKEFGNYVCDGNFNYNKLSEDEKELYNMILEIKS